MSKSSLIVFCYLPDSVVAVPAGRFDHDDQTDVGIFQYGKKYLERRNALSVDCVALPLGGDFLPATLNGGLYGAFRDSSPDYWGRLVISSRLHCPAEAVSEIDYLIHANATRVGNLDFRESIDAPEPSLSPPEFQNLGDLLVAADELEHGNITDERSGLLLEHGSSLGGARPKCTVEMNGELWLAKFPARNDRVNIPRVEYATMTLAASCGLNVPEICIKAVGDRDLFMVRRFDRIATDSGWARRGFLSALSFSEWDERGREHWSYRTVADRIRKYSLNTESDLHELFMRIVFNILVRNTDDHPRNHGFLIEKEGISLSPLFDVVPSLTRKGVGNEFSLAMSIGSQGRLATLENICSSASTFNLTVTQAQERAEEMRGEVASSWTNIFSTVGFNDKELDILLPSFSL